MKKIVILGGGISGLSLLWYLKKKYDKDADIKLLEKTSRVGGWIRTIRKEGFLFEKGPRSCRTNGQGKATLRLIEELGLQKQVIQADVSAHHRYLYYQQHLQKIPSSLHAFLFSGLTRKLIPSLLKECFVPKSNDEDESVHNFFSRRFSREVADVFADSMTLGIYACDSRKLSIKSCFPSMYAWEQQYGSLLKGAIRSWLGKSQEDPSLYIRKMQKTTLISFKEGMEYLPRILGQRLEESILLNHEVKGFKFHKGGIELQLKDGKIFHADQVYSTLPAYVLSHLIQPHHPETSQLLSHPSSSVAVVNIGYKRQVLPHKGFGYLVPSLEKEPILGMVWDSCVFPQQNASPEETRLTVMIGERKTPFSQFTDADFFNRSLENVSKHLNVHEKPDVFDVSIAHEAIPQYTFGYEQKKALIRKNISELSNRLILTGTSFNGVAINDCIAKAYEMAL